MIKRLLLRRYAFGLILFFALVGVAKAVLPLLAFVDLAVPVVESFVVRSVGRQVLSSVGVAANEASFVNTILNWVGAARVVGSIVLSGDNSKVYEVQVAPAASVDLARGVDGMGFYAMSPVYAVNALDHVAHYPSSLPKNSDPSVVAVTWAAWSNALSNPLDQMVFIPGSCADYDGDKWTCGFSRPNRGGSFFDTTAVFGLAPMELPDGIRRVVGTPGAWSSDSTDPDWTAEEKQRWVGLQALRVVGADNSVLDLFGNGSLQVRYQQALSAGVVRTLAFNTNTAFIPVAVEQVQAQGGIDAYPGASSQSSPGSTGTGSDITFPSDYARQGESVAASTSLGDRIMNGSDIPDPTVPGSGEFSDAFFKDTFASLLGWSLPGHTSACPTSSFGWRGSTFTFDSHCQLISDHFSALASAMTVVWTLLALFIILGA